MAPYEEVRDSIKTGDLCEFRSARGVIPWAIRKKTGKDVNHSATFVWQHVAGFIPRLFIVEAVAEGVEARLFSRRYERFEGDIFWSPLKSEHDGLRSHVEYWLWTQVGSSKEYDFEALLNYAVGRVVLDDTHLFCSECCQLALVEAGVCAPTEFALAPGELSQLGVYEERVQIK